MHECSSVESDAEEVTLPPGYITLKDVQWIETKDGSFWHDFTLNLHNDKHNYLLLRLHPRAGLPFMFARRFALSTAQ